jgi:flagellin-specific chaperone FliS
MMMRLTMVDVENDAQAARDVIGLLEPLQRSWHEVAERAEQKAESDDTSDNMTPSQITISA